MTSRSETERQAETLRLLNALQREIGSIHGEPILRRFRRWRDVRSPQLDIRQSGYDPAWPQLYRDAAARISAALAGTDHALHHIGSTSVPGLRAKPILDLVLALEVGVERSPVEQALDGLGYRDWGNSPAHPDVRWHWSTQTVSVQCVVHVCHVDCPWLPAALNFRDYLRAFPEHRDLYAALKAELADQDEGDIGLYSLRKAALLYRLNLQANAWRETSPEHAAEQ